MVVVLIWNYIVVYFFGVLEILFIEENFVVLDCFVEWFEFWMFDFCLMWEWLNDKVFVCWFEVGMVGFWLMFMCVVGKWKFS